MAEAEAMCAASPRARVDTIPNAGHDVHLERPDELAGVVIEVVDELDDAAKRDHS